MSSTHSPLIPPPWQVIPSPYIYQPYILTAADVTYATEYSPSIGEANVCESYGYFW